jgi:hypothetical protein
VAQQDITALYFLQDLKQDALSVAYDRPFFISACVGHRSEHHG